MHDGKPIVFFAGQIKGALDWQAEATQSFESIVTPEKNLHVVNPRWTNIAPADKLEPHAQRTWEKRHYRTAATAGRSGVRGVVMFYIAAENPLAEVPNPPGRAYGQGTRSEFSEIIGGKFFGAFDIELVLGIDPAHSGHGLKEYRHSAEEFGLHIHESLGATVAAAANIIFPQPAREV
jgi:hypothetical protein